jgi:hypothetical protein
MLKLKTIKCGEDLYVSANDTYSSYQALTDNHIVNGVTPTLEATHLRSWVKLVGVTEINTLQAYGSKIVVNTRWELVNPEDVSLGIPLTLTPEQADEYYDDDDYTYSLGSNSEYQRFSSMYTRKYDYQDGELGNIEFEIVNTQEVSVSDVDNFKDMKIATHINKSTKAEAVQNLSSLVTYSDIEQLLVHPLAIHNRPCSVSKDTTYNIVRNYIKQNINPHHARITSDYDFCFTVKKLVHIKPIEIKREHKKANGRSYATPKFTYSTKQHKELDLFEMCPAKKYGGYTPIDGFNGENLEDLAENIKLYLDELMEVINTPVHECVHCNGVGTTVDKVGCNIRGVNNNGN